MLQRIRKILNKILNRNQYDQFTRKRINFMFRVALNYYEARNKKYVDFPAFVYANRDIKKIIKSKKINEFYALTMKNLKEDFERTKNAI